MSNRGYLWGVFKHATKVSEPISHFPGHRAKLFGKKLQKLFFLFSFKSRKVSIINTRKTDFGQTLHVLDQKK